MNPLQPLAVTPSPINGESLLGFVLRISEMNGHTSPYDILRYAGISESNIRNIRIPLEALSMLSNRDVSTLESLAYTSQMTERRGKSFRLLGHHLSTVDIHIKTPKICPECIKERGCIDAYWDLRNAIACPKHGRYALTHCPGCGNRLSWQRRGLLICKCGFNLSECRGELVESKELLSLLELLRRKLESQTIDDIWGRQSSIPYGDLSKASLRTVLGIVHRLGNVKLGSTRSGRSKDVKQATFVAAKALSRWPHGLHDYLEEIGNNLSKKESESASVCQQFRRFYTAFFKNDLPLNELEFIKKGFLSFATDRWRKGIIDKRLDDGSGISMRLLGLRDIANRTGVSYVTVKRLVEKGILVPSHTIVTKGKTRYIFDCNKVAALNKPATGNTLGPREAAKRLMLPVNVLKALRDSGTFSVKNIPHKLASFHEFDLDAFKMDVINMVQPISKDQLGLRDIQLRAIMQMKAGGAEHKAAVIEAIIKSRLHSKGRIGDEIGDIVLNRDETMAFMRRLKYQNNGLMKHEAAKRIHCEPHVIDELISMGLLTTNTHNKVKFVTEESLNEFDSTYVSCAALAKSSGSSSRGVTGLLLKSGIRILLFGGESGLRQQPFVKRSLLSLPLNTENK